MSEPTLRSICFGHLVLCLALVGMGCERPETGAATPTVEAKPDRWVRRFLPPSDRWLRKSELPDEPQEWPRMVIWEVSSVLPGTKPTEEQKQAATDFVERCYAAAERNGWFDFEKGMAGGFEAMSDDNRHFRNEEFVFDDRLLDPERPEFLMYYPTPENEHELAGFMFFVRSRDEVGPQFGGMLTLWHWHRYNVKRCYWRSTYGLEFTWEGRCKRGEPYLNSPEMIHVWLIDHPDGRFASSMILEPELVNEKLAQRRKERGF